MRRRQLIQAAVVAVLGWSVARALPPAAALTTSCGIRACAAWWASRAA